MTHRTVYNKIVRDRIPEIIAANGDHAEVAVVSKEEAFAMLSEKLVEEANEARSASPENLGGELADVLEVTYALAELSGITASGLEKLRLQKRTERGGFEQRIKLIATN